MPNPHFCSDANNLLLHLYAQLKKLFRPIDDDDIDNSETLTEVIKSLIELNLMKEKVQEMEGLGQHTDVLITLFSRAADDACRYVSQTSMNTHGRAEFLHDDDIINFVVGSTM